MVIGGTIGFLVIESDFDRLSGVAVFHRTKEAAEADVKSIFQKRGEASPGSPVFIVAATRFMPKPNQEMSATADTD